VIQVEVRETVTISGTTVGQLVPMEGILVIDTVDINTLKKSNTGKSVYLEPSIIGVRMYRDGTIMVYCHRDDYNKIKTAIEQGKLYFVSDFIE
jgi:hypothetical protein